jgi:membrane-bound ClpP family serine protease
MGFLALSVASANADLIYLGIIFSLWIAVTAAYIPGTGIIEIFAFLGCVVSIMLLAQLPTNWIAVMLIVLGGSIFMLLPFINYRAGQLAVGGLLLQGLGGLFLFNSDLNVSWFIIGLSLLIPAAYHHFVLMPMLRNMKNRPINERDSEIIGKKGRVTHALDPVGTIYVNSEHWSATTEDGTFVGLDEHVVVIARENLRLVVEPIKRKRHENEQPLDEME